MQRNKDDKWGDPASWYESYHIKIDANAAQRAPGSPEDYLNPKWKEWSTFVDALRSSFSNRISREQAVTDWHLLKHTTSIDDYLDKLIRLMWRTGYKGQTVEDKLKRGLNHKLGEDWARVIRKPETVDEQIALLREMGHRMEDYNRTKQPGESTQKHETSTDRNPKRGSEQKHKPRGKKEFRKDKGKKTEWKERTVELKGIPEEVLRERKEADDCQKCGKHGHKWFECWTKEPVTKKFTGKAFNKKDVKIAALGEDSRTTERIMNVDSESEYELLLE